MPRISHRDTRTESPGQVCPTGDTPGLGQGPLPVGEGPACPSGVCPTKSVPPGQTESVRVAARIRAGRAKLEIDHGPALDAMSEQHRDSLAACVFGSSETAELARDVTPYIYRLNLLKALASGD